jgi:hypothetical protein
MTRRSPGVLTLALAPVLYSCVLHAIFVSSVRYRAPAMPLVDLLAGAGVADLATAKTVNQPLESATKSSNGEEV